MGHLDAGATLMAPGSTRMCQRPGGDPPGLLPTLLHMHNHHQLPPPGHCSGGQLSRIPAGQRAQECERAWLARVAGASHRGPCALVRDLSFH